MLFTHNMLTMQPYAWYDLHTFDALQQHLLDYLDVSSR